MSLRNIMSRHCCSLGLPSLVYGLNRQWLKQSTLDYLEKCVSQDHSKLAVFDVIISHSLNVLENVKMCGCFQPFLYFLRRFYFTWYWTIYLPQCVNAHYACMAVQLDAAKMIVMQFRICLKFEPNELMQHVTLFVILVSRNELR